MPGIQTQKLVSERILKAALALFHSAGARGTTRLEMGRHLGVSYKALDRILSLLQEEGALIENHREKGRKIYVMTRPPRWDRRVSPQARLALRLAGLALTATGTAQWNQLLQGLEQLADEAMTAQDRKLFEALKSVATLPGEDQDVIEAGPVLEPLLRAIREGRRAVITYRSASANSPRAIELIPFRLVHDLFAGGAFLLAWSPERSRAEHLRLNRIDDVAPGRISRLAPQALAILESAAAHQVGGWTSGEAPFDVRVRISGSNWIQALYEAPPMLPAVEVERIEHGRALLVTFKADHMAGVKRWILQFGSQARVIAPEWLASEIRAEWQAALA